MEEDKLIERSAMMGRRLLAGLQSLSNLANVGDVRGLGMMCAVELVENKQTKAPALGLGGKVAREALSRGLFTRLRAGGANPAIGDTICIAPPLMTPVETLDRIVDILRDSIVAATK
jgi:4-aminobutyrate aminotransferase-like enzyme